MLASDGGVHFTTPPKGCGGDQIDDHVISDQGFGAPVLSDEREQPVLYLIQFARSRREVMNLDQASSRWLWSSF
jgi:hypothetical protein